MNKVVLITGAAGGIGTALAAYFAKEGYRLALAEHPSQDISNLIASWKDTGVEIDTFVGDLTQADFADHLPRKVSDRFGQLDVVVNNAGVMRRGSILDTSDDDFRVSMAVNVEAPFRICRSAIDLMQKTGGAIVNISSCWGKYPGPNHLIYCATKAALASMTQCMGRDHARQHIRINAVCPNEVNTPMLETGFRMRGLDPKSAIASLGESVPIGHVADPAEIASVVGFLASDQARYICGTLVEVNGGKPVY